MKSSTVFLGWIGGGVGILLVYAAYRNMSPVSVLTSTLSGEDRRTTLTETVPTRTATDVARVTSPGSASLSDVQRAEGLRARQIQPQWVPIPTQPNMLLDRIAMVSFMKVQNEYGRLLPLTGARRSVEDQAQGYQRNPDRFAPPGRSLHEVGLAIDLNTNAVNVDDPKLFQVFSSHGWYRVGKSGKMHWSYGVPG